MKAFLEGLVYFLILGDTEGIETDYKKVVRGSRELPMSSCPSYIEDSVYGAGITTTRAEDDNRFEATVESVDAKLDKLSSYYKKPPAKKPKAHKGQTRCQRFLSAMGRLNVDRSAFTHVVVDTDGVFTYGGDTYVVRAQQYQAIATEDGEDCFVMDRIVCVDGVHFYDMSMNEVSEFVEKLF